MVKKSSRLPIRSSAKPLSRGADGHAMHNEILLGLPRAEFDAVFAKLELLEMPTHGVLNDVGEPIEQCYFMNSGLASILSVLSDGKSVEVGLVGKEGFVGLPLVVGLKTSATRAVIQIAGTAYRVTAANLAAVLRTCPQLEKSLNRYSQAFALQATQVAACNRVHDVEERMARWLLMSQDRIGGDLVPLTQEFLAHMLGTRRASVTVAAGILQKAGLITYRRGAVKIMHRGNLEDAACECYEMLVSQGRNWKKESQ